LPWRLHLVDSPQAGSDGKIPVGTMYRAKLGDDEGFAIFLPGGVIWWTYQHPCNGGRWAIAVPPEGPEHMTVSPSINFVPDGWHGWIKDGVISDDVSGKQF